MYLVSGSLCFAGLGWVSLRFGRCILCFYCLLCVCGL